MQFTTTSLLALAAIMPQAMAHYNFDRLIVNGQVSEPYEYVRKMTNGNGPLYDVKSNDIRCNVGSQDAAATTKTHPVKAGDTVGFTILDVLGHPGPLFAYMSKSTVDDVSKYDGSGDWFKIYELGVRTYANYSTAMTWLSDGFKNYTFTIPKDIEDGQYLLRAEHIAIHSAGSDEGAQFYLSCAQIEVTGGTGAKPSPVGKFPGIYDAKDPGIWFDVYWPPVVNYTMPGPAVYPEGGSFPPFTADPNGPAATQPLPATATGGSGSFATGGAAAPAVPTTTAPASSSAAASTSAAAEPTTLATVVASPSATVLAAEASYSTAPDGSVWVCD